MNQTQANRMAALMEMLLNLEDDHRFDMNWWTTTSNVESEDQALKCNTACCAAGWAALIIPSWKRHFKFNNNTLELRSGEDLKTPWKVYIYLAEFLGITESESECIFAPKAYGIRSVLGITPLDVTRHIKAVMKSYDYKLEIS